MAQPWVKTPDSDIDPDSPITTGLMTTIRDNLVNLAIIGAIVLYPLATPPTDHLECDGSAISRTTYADLFAVIGTAYGVGDGSTTFNIPDYRGEFLRGWDHGAANDPDRASRTNRGDGTTGDNVGTKQSDQYKSHRHSYQVTDFTDAATTYPTGSGTPSVTTSYSNYSGGNETRPRNINIMPCIRYAGG